MPAAITTPEGITWSMAHANQKWARLAKAEGQCFTASARLQMAMEARGLEPVLLEAYWQTILNHGNHYAVEVDGTVYDLTMRQFVPECAFPWIGTVEEWVDEVAGYHGCASEYVTLIREAAPA